MGWCMKDLGYLLGVLYEETIRMPLGARGVWDGTFSATDDWRSLIDFWYAVRCSVVHGIAVPNRYVTLAYKTLFMFMDELFCRMEKYHGKGVDILGVDMQRFHDVTPFTNTRKKGILKPYVVESFL